MNIRKLVGLVSAIVLTLSFLVPTASAGPAEDFSATVVRSCEDNSITIFFDPFQVIGISYTLTNESSNESLQAGSNPTTGEIYPPSGGRNFDRVVLHVTFSNGSGEYTAYMGQCGIYDLDPIGGPPPVDPVDTDGDGLTDDVDECPTVAGPASNGGCPVAEEPVDPVVPTVPSVDPEKPSEPATVTPVVSDGSSGVSDGGTTSGDGSVKSLPDSGSGPDDNSNALMYFIIAGAILLLFGGVGARRKA